MTFAKRIIRNSFFLSLTTLADRFAEVVLFFLMARSLGPGFVGDYKTVVMFLSIFQNLANFGLMQLVMREVATIKNRQQVAELLISYGFAGLVIALGLLVIMNVAATLVSYPPAITLGIYVVSLALLPSAWRRVAEATISGLENMEYIALISFLGAIFRIVVTTLLLWRGGSLMAIFWALVITQIAIVPAYLWVINRFLVRVRFRPDPAKLLGIAREVATFLLMGILVIGVGTQIDVLMIRKMTSAEQAGLYTTASTLVQTLLLVRPAILNSVFPHMALLYKSSVAKFQSLTTNLVKLSVVALLPFPFAALILAKPLMPLLLGVSFADSAVTLQVLIWIIVPSFAYATLSRVLVAGQQERSNTLIAAAGMLVNIVLNLILIPRFGATGAAISSVTSMLVATIASYFVIKERLFTIRLGEVLGKPLLCVLATVIAALPLQRASLWFSLPILAGVYLVALLWTRTIPKNALIVVRDLVAGRLSARARKRRNTSAAQETPWPEQSQQEQP